MGITWPVLLAVALVVGLIVWLRRQRGATRRTWRERFGGLQWRMTFSYVWITIASVLIGAILLNFISFVLVPIAILIGLLIWFKNRHAWSKHFSSLRWRSPSTYIWIAITSIVVLLALFNSASTFFRQTTLWGQPTSPRIDNISTVNQAAQAYANNIAQQAQHHALGTKFSYPLGRPLTSDPGTYTDVDAHSLLRSGEVPYLPKLYPANQPVSFVLLIAPDQRILSSSYPARYPVGMQTDTLLPIQQSRWIAQALHGHDLNGTFDDTNGTMIYATASVLDEHGRAVGAVYMQVPLTTLQTTEVDFFSSLRTSLGVSLLIVLVLFVVLAPFGGIFGFFSTRGLVRRLKKLADATTLVADGDYQPRLQVASKDEVGQLELQFNRMTEQLGESMARQKTLAEENARLAERSRISRELHDAISQDLFSLSLLAGGLQCALPVDSPLQQQVDTLEQTTNHTIREMRALLLELRPTRLEQLSLVEALAELASAYSTRLGVGVKTDLAHLQLEARQEHALLRVAQEALANAARHANATEITLTLAQQASMVCFCVRDNGRGFQADAESLRHGLGLRMMQERVQELHGMFKLESSPDQGTTLEIRLPLEEIV